MKQLFLATLFFSYTSFSCDYMINTFANKNNVSKGIERVAKKYENTASVLFENKEFSNIPLSLQIAIFLQKYRVHVDERFDEIYKNFRMFSPENKKYRQSIYEVIPSELMRVFFKIDYENIFNLKRYCAIEQWSQENFNYLTLLAFINTTVNDDTPSNSVKNVLRTNIDNCIYSKYETKFDEAERQINTYVEAFKIRDFILSIKQMFNDGNCLHITTEVDENTFVYTDKENIQFITYNKSLHKIHYDGISYFFRDLLRYYKKYHICTEQERETKIKLTEGYMVGINYCVNQLTLEIQAEYQNFCEHNLVRKQMVNSTNLNNSTTSVNYIVDYEDRPALKFNNSAEMQLQKIALFEDDDFEANKAPKKIPYEDDDFKASGFNRKQRHQHINTNDKQDKSYSIHDKVAAHISGLSNECYLNKSVNEYKSAMKSLDKIDDYVTMLTTKYRALPRKKTIIQKIESSFGIDHFTPRIPNIDYEKSFNGYGNKYNIDKSYHMVQISSNEYDNWENLLDDFEELDDYN